MKILKNLLNAIFVKKPFKEGDAKVKDHDDIAGKYRGSAHQDCNLNLKITKKSLLCFIICKIMIPIFCLKKLENIIIKDDTENTRKIYNSLTIKQAKKRSLILDFH